jgi:hypothetical protein
MSRSSPYPDDLAERDYYDSLLGAGKGDPDNIRWIGEDRAEVHRQVENVHWSELPKSTYVFPPRDWYDQDNNPASPLEQDKE